MRSDLFASSPESGSIAAASRWIAELLGGQVVTLIAVLAIALLGYEMLSGRISVRRAFKVVIGCFILFGSPVIALGVIETTRETAPIPAPSRFETSPLPFAGIPAETSGNPFDPYAGTQPPN